MIASNASRKESTRRIDLEIERAVEPIQGLVHEGERSLSFSGWLGLAGALGRLVASDSEQSTRLDETPGTKKTREWNKQ